MSKTRVAVIGTGPHPETAASRDGYSMGYRHARDYRDIENCSLVACADIVPKHARDFAAEFGVADERVYEDYCELLADIEPDLVSVCTPPKTHPDIVDDCAQSGHVRGIHCEKPMAHTWGESTRMVDLCQEAGVRLTFNLQSRCSEAAMMAKELLDAGEIGDLRRLEVSRRDLLQTAIHNISMAHYFNDDRDVEWVIGQVDYRDERVWYTDMYSEDQAIGQWAYENGVQAIICAGDDFETVGRFNRIIGTEGVIELGPRNDPPLRIRRRGDMEWEAVDAEVGTGSKDAQCAALATVIDALERDEPSPLDADVALDASKVVYAIWESARRRGRVELPLDIEDNPLADLIESSS